jgi:hypothetical protein
VVKEEEGKKKTQETRRSGEENGIHLSGISESAIDIKECDHIALAIIISTHVFFFLFCPQHHNPKQKEKLPNSVCDDGRGSLRNNHAMQHNTTQHGLSDPAPTRAPSKTSRSGISWMG